MGTLEFRSNRTRTVGIELELGLVDRKTKALTSKIEQLLKEFPGDPESLPYKPELMQCYIEVNTGVCNTIDEAKADLEPKLVELEHAADRIGVDLWWGATHPFSTWRDQNVTPTDRYLNLIGLLQDMARQLVTFGLHVHVGVDSGDKAVMICDRIMQHLPTLLALTTSSPFWDGHMTGLQSHRSKIMEGLPTAGLPPMLRNWSEYVWLVNQMVNTGFINTIREIWWDVRPHHAFGTVEVRVCDMPGNLNDSLAIAGFVQCLVKALSDQIDEGTYQHDCHPFLVRQNKWRACRYGTHAQLVNSRTHQTESIPTIVNSLVDRLDSAAKELECRPYLEHVRDIANAHSWADRQVEIYEENEDPAEVVSKLVKQSRISESPSSWTPGPATSAMESRSKSQASVDQ